jgi:hypothetical protein
MTTWLDLTFREVVILALLAALGAGPAAFLRDTQAGTRTALAPALGLALGATALVSAGNVTSLGTAAWVVLLPMILISLAILAVKERRRPRGSERSPAVATGLKICLLIVVVTSALNYPLAHRDSLGPVAYRVSDAAYYVEFADRLESHSLSDRSHQPTWDLTSAYGNGVAQAPANHVGVSAVAASVNSLFGWRAADAQSAWMIAMVALIALGAFAAVQEFTASRTWAAPFAGVLMAGPFMFQLFIDGSQGALAYLALFSPLAVLGARVIRQPRPADVVLIALLLAGELSLYEAGVPGLAVWAAAIVGVMGVAAALQGRLRREAVLRTAKIVAVIALLAVALAPLAFGQALDFYRQYLAHSFDEAGVPYKLPLGLIPSWLLQSRELYGIQEHPVVSSVSQLLLTVLVPIALAAVAVFGILRHRGVWIVAAVVPTAVVLAYRSYLSIGGPLATYAVDRNLLIVATAGVILFSVGLAALAAAGRTAPRVAAVLIAAAALVVAGGNSFVMARRILEGGQIVPGSIRQSLAALSGRHGVLYLEGAGTQFPDATLQMPAIYDLLNEATPNQMSMDLTNNDYRGPLYLGGFVPNGPWFDPSYSWVFTLVPSIKTNRTPVARVGSIAIEHRTRPLDVTVVGGIATDPPARDPAGSAWVQGQLKLLVTGATDGPVWVRLALEGSPVRPAGPPGARVVSSQPGRTVVCVPVSGSGPVRNSVASFGFDVKPWPAVPTKYALPLPNHSLRLAGMWAVRDCSARARAARRP